MRTYIVNLIIVLIVLCTSNCGKKNDFNCSDNEYYFKAKYNNKDVCYSICAASIIDNSDSSSMTFVSKYITEIVAGEVTDSLFTSIIIIFLPNKSIGFYEYDSLVGIDYSIATNYNDKTYSFPFHFEREKNDFEINISNFDTINKVVEGTFRGILYSSFIDSLIIEKGEFRALYSKKNIF